jgi:hypothetical protein
MGTSVVVSDQQPATGGQHSATVERRLAVSARPCLQPSATAFNPTIAVRANHQSVICNLREGPVKE